MILEYVREGERMMVMVGGVGGGGGCLYSHPVLLDFSSTALLPN